MHENMYKSTENLLEGLRSAFPLQLFPWDDYFARMAETDFFDGRADTASVKSFFIRKAPFGSPYALLGGITDALRTINDLSFDRQDFVDGMLDMGYSSEFVEYLKDKKRLRVKVYAPPEGALFFPEEPVVTVEGPLADIRLVEGILTEALNFPTLVMTKWHRMVRSVRPSNVLEFGRRRAQNAMKAALYGILAGCSSTSNAELRRHFKVQVIGTMGHEFIQSYGNVEDAFEAWLTHQPSRPVGLVDTKQCLEHDFPAWLDAVYRHKERIKEAGALSWGWRNDSGDLAYLSIEQYVRFMRHPLAEDRWFRENMRIVLTNDLDEYTATEIIQKIRTHAGQAGLNYEDILQRIVWAAGTKPSTCNDQPSLGGVAKLMEVEGEACIKLALDDTGKPGPKTSVPGYNFSALALNPDGEVQGVVIYPATRYSLENGTLCDKSRKEKNLVVAELHNTEQVMQVNYSLKAQQAMVYDSYEGTGFTEYWDNPTIGSVQERIRKNTDTLPWWMTALDTGREMPVFLTRDLAQMRDVMIRSGSLRRKYTFLY